MIQEWTSRPWAGFFMPGLMAWLVIATIGGDAYALVKVPALREGGTFLEARHALISSGWIPRITKRRYADGTLMKESGDAAALLKAGYPEIEYCSGTGMNYCIFHYTRQSECLQLVTYGEYQGDGSAPKVLRWSQECYSE